MSWTPEQQAQIDNFARTALELASIPATDADVATFAQYVKLDAAGAPYIAGGLPVPLHGRGTYTIAAPNADDPPRTVPDLLGGGTPLALSPVTFALDLAAAHLITHPLGFRGGVAHSWSSTINAS